MQSVRSHDACSVFVLQLEWAPRPEKSGKESTSLGMSSLPTSDGFNHPACSSGQSPEIANPTSLARSVSASVCPVKPSDPDSIEPKAVKALEASAKFQINSKKKEHLSLQDHSDHASSADHAPTDQSPAMPLQNSSEETTVAGNLEKFAERSTQGLRFHLHTRQEASLSVTTTRMHEPQMFLGEKDWHPENQNVSQVNGLQQHEEPGNEQDEVAQQNTLHDREYLCNIGDHELPEERRQNQHKIVDLKAMRKGNGLPQNVEPPSTKKSIPPSGCSGCSNSETLMEIDVAEQSPVTVLNSTGRQNASVKNIGALDLTLDNPLMEVETSKHPIPSSEILNDSISTQDLQPAETNVEISGTNEEYGHYSSSPGLCGSCQPSVESAEDSCSSVTAALKELHELLVVSSKPASENTSEEVIYQSETVAEGQTSIKDLSERWTQNEQLTQKEQCPQVSFHQAISVSVKTEKLTSTSSVTGIEAVENGDGLSTDKDGVPKSRESINENNSITITSAKTSNQLHCTLGVEISPKLLSGEEDALNQTSEQTKSLSSNFILVKDLGQAIQNSIADRPEARENVCPEASRPFPEYEPPTSHPSSSPSILPPCIFPATDIDRILRAGFTLQEALGALHRVGGNADLALLVLLAKNIVVPT
ncbi:protein DDI1 homolog 2 isoform X3 [Cebus imitator]|uniref:protein DDI1 homolog 2 isoform X3 n=1 Tax=Cebus imitator TaxID=2715852 RepID=UPI000809CAB1|nr:protein DDI1 homolog 2 isoform X3 [Cebus imitator]